MMCKYFEGLFAYMSRCTFLNDTLHHFNARNFSHSWDTSGSFWVVVVPLTLCPFPPSYSDYWAHGSDSSWNHSAWTRAARKPLAVVCSTRSIAGGWVAAVQRSHRPDPDLEWQVRRVLPLLVHLHWKRKNYTIIMYAWLINLIKCIIKIIIDFA